MLSELQAMDADIILLQEVDVGCERTGGVDVGLQLAKVFIHCIYVDIYP